MLILKQKVLADKSMVSRMRFAEQRDSSLLCRLSADADFSVPFFAEEYFDFINCMSCGTAGNIILNTEYPGFYELLCESEVCSAEGEEL